MDIVLLSELFSCRVVLLSGCRVTVLVGFLKYFTLNLFND